MSNRNDAFDAIGVVVDWIDACRQGQLADLVDLYDDEATLDCCGGDRFEGRDALQRYWKPKLQKRLPSAFGIDALMPEATGVCVDYRDYDGQAVRTHFRFNPQGKIVHTDCAPLASPLAALGEDAAAWKIVNQATCG